MPTIKATDRKLEDVSVINSPSGSDVTTSNGDLTISNISKTLKLDRISSVTTTTYAAGTAAVKLIDCTGFTTSADGRSYRIPIKHNGEERVYRVNVATSDVDDIGSEFETVINNDPFAVVSASYDAGTDDLTITQDSDADVLEGGDFTFGDITDDPTVTDDGTGASVVFVAPEGTPGIVEDFDSANVDSTKSYTTYEIFYDELESHNGISGLKARRPISFIVFADKDAANYAAFNNRMSGLPTQKIEELKFSNPAFAGSSWSAKSTHSELAASATAEVAAIRLDGMKVGDVIYNFSIQGRVTSGGNVVTVDAELFKVEEGASLTATSLGSITQISETSDASFDSTHTLSTPETIEENTHYYIEVKGTTATSTTVELTGADVEAGV